MLKLNSTFDAWDKDMNGTAIIIMKEFGHSASRTDIDERSACKKIVFTCDGLFYDLMWRVSLSVLKLENNWLSTTTTTTNQTCFVLIDILFNVKPS